MINKIVITTFVVSEVVGVCIEVKQNINAMKCFKLKGNHYVKWYILSMTLQRVNTSVAWI